VFTIVIFIVLLVDGRWLSLESLKLTDVKLQYNRRYTIMKLADKDYILDTYRWGYIESTSLKNHYMILDGSGEIVIDRINGEKVALQIVIQHNHVIDYIAEMEV